MCLTLPLSCAGIEASLPLCAATLRGLEQALWLTDDIERANALLATLRFDPLLACYFIAELLPEEALPSPTLAALAAWAAPSLAMLLGEKLHRNEFSQSDIGFRAAEVVVQAELVLRLAQEHGCAEPASYALSALARGGVSLIQLSHQASTSSAQEARRLSTWLSQEIGLPDASIFCTVAEKLREQFQSQEEQLDTVSQAGAAACVPIHASAQLLENCDRLASDVRRHWERRDATAATELLRLVRRLAPLESLQQNFTTRLETEKLHAMKELAYGAGHEINNPLANISVRAQTLIKQESDPERRRMLAAINGQVYRAHEMIADLMLFAQPPKLAPTPTDLQSLLERTATGLLPDAGRQNTILLVRPSETPLVVSVDGVQLALALHAMIVNSLEAMGQGGKIELQLGLRKAARGKRWAEIRVRDDGPGIEGEVRRHLFDPFYSGREAGRGLGFGLSKCWRIVTSHGGRIEVESSPGEGACFKILLPTEKSGE
jgi:signal transduction histidine kinase